MNRQSQEDQGPGEALSCGGSAPHGHPPGDIQRRRAGAAGRTFPHGPSWAHRDGSATLRLHKHVCACPPFQKQCPQPVRGHKKGRTLLASLLPVPKHLWTETDCNCAQCLEPEGTVPWGLTERGQEAPQEPGAGLRHEGCVAAVTGESARQTNWFPPTHLLIWTRGGSGGSFCPGRASAVCQMPRSPCSRPARTGCSWPSGAPSKVLGPGVLRGLYTGPRVDPPCPCMQMSCASHRSPDHPCPDPCPYPDVRLHQFSGL